MIYHSTIANSTLVKSQKTPYFLIGMDNDMLIGIITEEYEG